MAAKKALAKLAEAAIAAEEAEEAAPAVVDPKTFEQVIVKGTEFLNISGEIDRLEAELEPLKDRYKQLREHELPEIMRGAGLVGSNNKGSFTTGGFKIFLETKLYASMIKEQKFVLFKWLRRQRAGEMIQETVNASTLAAFVRERRAEGAQDPPGVAVHETTVAKKIAVR